MSVQYPTEREIAALGRLTSEQRQYLNGAVTRGLGPTAALAELSAGGIGIRTQVGLDAYRAIAGVRLVSGYINNIPFPFQPSTRLFVPAEYPIGYQYRVWTTVLATNTQTGEQMTLRHVVGSDTLLTRQGWLELAAAGMANAIDAYQVDFATEDIVITTAESNPP